MQRHGIVDALWTTARALGSVAVGCGWLNTLSRYAWNAFPQNAIMSAIA
jgi:hypothetical protein